MSNDILVPNIGDFNNVEIIEVLIKEGQEIEKGDTVITLESDKSSVEVPSNISGIVKVVHIKIGDKVSEGSLVASLEGTIESTKINLPDSENKKNIEDKDKVDELKNSIITQPTTNVIGGGTVSAQSVVFSNNGVGVSGASPKIMKFARELGISVNDISGSGRQGRVLEQDIKNYVGQNLNKNKIEENDTLSSKTEKVDSDALPYQHNEFGDVDVQTIPRIKKMSGPHLVRAWNTIPHVTQHDELDITEMESFRKGLVNLNTREKISITPLAFMMKALVNGMQRFTNFNSSLDQDKVVYKKYFHIGVAVDTPHGLMVPKIRDVNTKSLSDLSKEVRSVSKLCKELKIDKKEFFGGSMTISSLGGIGGSFFTPIINSPEVAIIGMGKSEIKPVFINGKFEPRMMMPISLSYDHRIIDGAEAAKFCQDLKISLGRNFAVNLAI
ncbi:pyruvate dehydrogenase E1 component [Candidatus Pelagibacter sp. IMCC9063]|uniref:2-oxo acid dehydrogenase subunit E2 n=1 Tax=Pelagibacter sp. (strain IMCC9063) TaxID=1002672 RepID=UPI0002046395|nr:2-oxo acid dehydrogenase subunit E2 [Candidatus Pelagibacter sp. IMCC9063]AEA81096.1 pyruvate dehydrogenase E1 component [Candidatus Pelagibacter sp. IMCC9063]